MNPALLALVACSARVPVPVALPTQEVVSERSIPSETLDVLDVAAGDLDVNIRQEAISLLVAYAVNPEPHASRGLYDPSPYVRRRTAQALGGRLPEEPSRVLLDGFVLREDLDPYTRGYAATELGLAGYSDARDVLSAAAHGQARWWQAAPLHLAALAMGSEESLAPLTAGLAKGDFPLEMKFFLDCHRLGRPELGPPLVTAAGRVEEELVLPIATSLVRLGDPAGIELFRERLDSEVVEARLEAIDFIAQLPVESGLSERALSHHSETERAFDLLLNRALKDEHASVSTYARLVQVRWGRESPSVAFDLLVDADREVRVQSLWALRGRIALDRHLGTEKRRLEKRALEQAAEALEDTEDVVVREAIRLLGVIGGPSAVELLTPLYSMESTAFRVEVAAALLTAG
ncbi:MAG: hypothetical protein VX519_12395 [Myxococcota bacterium]|nr:hypothetical protein [Myxococcota bacterium]